MSKWLKISVAIVLLLSVAVMAMVGCAPSAEKAAAEFYKDKTVTLLVGYSPGGGIDSTARLLLPYHAKYAGTNMVVENKPGAGGNIAINYLYNNAQPDGLTIMKVPGAGSVTSVLTGTAGVEYDLMKLEWMGNANYSTMAVCVATNGPYQTLKQIMDSTQPVKFGLNSKTTSQGQEAAVIAHDLKINTKMVVGYGGTADIRKALLQGEVDVLVTSDADAKQRDPAEIKTLCLNSEERISSWPEIPTIYEASGLKPEDTPWVNLRRTIVKLGHPYAAPPGTPEDRVKYLSAALEKAIADPEFQAAAEQAGYVYEWRSPEDEVAMMESVLTLPAETVKEFNYILMDEFYQ